jgi:hypothetical protein
MQVSKQGKSTLNLANTQPMTRTSMSNTLRASNKFISKVSNHTVLTQPNVNNNRNVSNLAQLQTNGVISQTSFFGVPANEVTNLNDTDYKNKVLVVNSVNCKSISQNSYNLDDMWINHLHFCYPRPLKEEDLIVRQRTPWSFPISIWARQFYYDYEGEGDEAYFAAFEHDFNRCNFSKELKNDQNLVDDLKILLWDYYKKM